MYLFIYLCLCLLVFEGKMTDEACRYLPSNYSFSKWLQKPEWVQISQDPGSSSGSPIGISSIHFFGIFGAVFPGALTGAGLHVAPLEFESEF